jgi:hypothetical protein
MNSSAELDIYSTNSTNELHETNSLQLNIDFFLI